MTPDERCGSNAGYSAHRRRREVPCWPCTDAHTAAVRAWRFGNQKGPRELVPCGSPAAYRRHLRRREAACAECKAGHAAREKARYDRTRASAA